MRSLGLLFNSRRLYCIRGRPFPAYLRHCLRRHVSGLFFVSAEPLLSHPNADASIAVSELLHQENHQLSFYGALHRPSSTQCAALAISVVDDYEKVKDRVINTLQPLPSIPRVSAESEAVEFAKVEEMSEEEMEPIDLPAELQPQAMGDNIPKSDPSEGWEPYDDSIDDMDWDSEDIKNCPDFDPYQDPEMFYFSGEAPNAWIKADREGCSKGARPRAYRLLEDLKNESSVVWSELYDPLPLVAPPVSRCLLIYQVPHTRPDPTISIPDTPTPKTNEDFAQMFKRYAYLTSDAYYHRISAFQQDDPTFPRWLIVQEFVGPNYFNHDYALAKQQAEYWWRKNGWEGVLVEFFGARDVMNDHGAMKLERPREKDSDKEDTVVPTS